VVILYDMDTILYNMLYTVLQWNTVEYSATVEDTVIYSVTQCYSGIQWNTVRQWKIQWNTVRASATVEYMSAKTVEMTH
jgi:hypothetical protein